MAYTNLIHTLKLARIGTLVGSLTCHCFYYLYYIHRITVERVHGIFIPVRRKIPEVPAESPSKGPERQAANPEQPQQIPGQKRSVPWQVLRHQSTAAVLIEGQLQGLEVEVRDKALGT